MKLNDRLAELRREHGLTLRGLRDRIAERTGAQLSISYLSELERKDSLPSMEMLGRLARGYDVSLHDLLAPVDFFSQDGSGQYPKALGELVESGMISDEWAITLSRIEFRGRRPESEDEWQAIYSMLKAFIEPKLEA
ncbi:MAG: helix-turn-helix domain-containing protein [Thermomicrobiales bacterium]